MRRRVCGEPVRVLLRAASGLLSDIGFQGPELRFESLTRAAPGQPSRSLLLGLGCATVAPSHGLRPRTQGTSSPRSHSRSRAPQPLFATPLHESFAMSTLRSRNQACGTALRAFSLRRLGWTTSLRTPPGEASTPSRSWIARCQDSACVALRAGSTRPSAWRKTAVTRCWPARRWRSVVQRAVSPPAGAAGPPGPAGRRAPTGTGGPRCTRACGGGSDAVPVRS